jgi:hypothetical protein
METTVKLNWFVIEERRSGSEWHFEKVTGFPSKTEAEKYHRGMHAMFRSTPGCRWVLTDKEPEGVTWE